jgi:plastocyanin
MTAGHDGLMTARCLALLAVGALAAGWALPAQAETREFHIVTVHLDGHTGIAASADHPAEAFPETPMPPGGGLILTKPNADGKWRMRAFVFQPAQVIVRQGDEVKLTFVGSQGPMHKIKVDGVADEIVLKRGEIRSVTVKADKVGSISYVSVERMPSMRGEVVVLPK